MCLYLCLRSSVWLIICPFHVPCSICKYLGPVITILNYIAALLTLSSKDFLSYFFTVQSDYMVICSLNVRALSNNTKRRETFLWLKKKRFSICSLQEVHSTNETEPYWHSEWGYSTIFTTFSSSWAGGACYNVERQVSISNFETFCRPRRHRYWGQNYDTYSSKCLRA